MEGEKERKEGGAEREGRGGRREGQRGRGGEAEGKGEEKEGGRKKGEGGRGRNGVLYFHVTKVKLQSVATIIQIEGVGLHGLVGGAQDKGSGLYSLTGEASDKGAGLHRYWAAGLQIRGWGSPGLHRPRQSVSSGHMTSERTVSGDQSPRMGARYVKGVACCLGNNTLSVTQYPAPSSLTPEDAMLPVTRPHPLLPHP